MSTQLPCLNSSEECIEELTRLAIDNSNELETISERLELIEEQLKAVEDRIEYIRKRKWVVFASVNPIQNPLRLAVNIFGGGEMQTYQNTMATLEVRASSLVTSKAELERKADETKTSIGDKVLELMLDYEKSDRLISLLLTQIETFNLQNEVFRIQYRFGNGTTRQFLSLSDKSDRLNEKLVDARIKRSRSKRELLQLTGFSGEVETSN